MSWWKWLITGLCAIAVVVGIVVATVCTGGLLLAVCVGALIGAGMCGFFYSLTRAMDDKLEWNWGDFFKNVAFGTVTGAISGGIFHGLGAALQGCSFLVKAGSYILAGAGNGLLDQVFSNVLWGRPIFENWWQSMMIGAISGLLACVAEEVGKQALNWLKKKWNGNEIQNVFKFINKNVQYFVTFPIEFGFDCIGIVVLSWLTGNKIEGKDFLVAFTIRLVKHAAKKYRDHKDAKLVKKADAAAEKQKYDQQEHYNNETENKNAKRQAKAARNGQIPPSDDLPPQAERPPATAAAQEKDMVGRNRGETEIGFSKEGRKKEVQQGKMNKTEIDQTAPKKKAFSGKKPVSFQGEGCAEDHAMGKILQDKPLKDQTPKQIRSRAKKVDMVVLDKDGKYKPPCKHCKQWGFNNLKQRYLKPRKPDVFAGLPPRERDNQNSTFESVHDKEKMDNDSSDENDDDDDENNSDDDNWEDYHSDDDDEDHDDTNILSEGEEESEVDDVETNDEGSNTTTVYLLACSAAESHLRASILDSFHQQTARSEQENETLRDLEIEEPVSVFSGVKAREERVLGNVPNGKFSEIRSSGARSKDKPFLRENDDPKIYKSNNIRNLKKSSDESDVVKKIPGEKRDSSPKQNLRQNKHQKIEKSTKDVSGFCLVNKMVDKNAQVVVDFEVPDKIKTIYFMNSRNGTGISRLLRETIYSMNYVISAEDALISLARIPLLCYQIDELHILDVNSLGGKQTEETESGKVSNELMLDLFSFCISSHTILPIFLDSLLDNNATSTEINNNLIDWIKALIKRLSYLINLRKIVSAQGKQEKIDRISILFITNYQSDNEVVRWPSWITGTERFWVSEKLPDFLKNDTEMTTDAEKEKAKKEKKELKQCWKTIFSSVDKLSNYFLSPNSTEVQNSGDTSDENLCCYPSLLKKISELFFITSEKDSSLAVAAPIDKSEDVKDIGSVRELSESYLTVDSKMAKDHLSVQLSSILPEVYGKCSSKRKEEIKKLFPNIEEKAVSPVYLKENEEKVVGLWFLFGGKLSTSSLWQGIWDTLVSTDEIRGSVWNIEQGLACSEDDPGKHLVDLMKRTMDKLTDFLKTLPQDHRILKAYTEKVKEINEKAKTEKEENCLKSYFYLFKVVFVEGSNSIDDFGYEAVNIALNCASMPWSFFRQSLSDEDKNQRESILDLWCHTAVKEADVLFLDEVALLKNSLQDRPEYWAFIQLLIRGNFGNELILRRLIEKDFIYRVLQSTDLGFKKLKKYVLQTLIEFFSSLDRSIEKANGMEIDISYRGLFLIQTGAKKCFDLLVRGENYDDFVSHLTASVSDQFADDYDKTVLVVNEKVKEAKIKHLLKGFRLLFMAELSKNIAKFVTEEIVLFEFRTEISSNPIFSFWRSSHTFDVGFIEEEKLIISLLNWILTTFPDLPHSINFSLEPGLREEIRLFLSKNPLYVENWDTLASIALSITRITSVEDNKIKAISTIHSQESTVASNLNKSTVEHMGIIPVLFSQQKDFMINICSVLSGLLENDLCDNPRTPYKLSLALSLVNRMTIIVDKESELIDYSVAVMIPTTKLWGSFWVYTLKLLRNKFYRRLNTPLDLLRKILGFIRIFEGDERVLKHLPGVKSCRELGLEAFRHHEKFKNLPWEMVNSMEQAVRNNTENSVFGLSSLAEPVLMLFYNIACACDFSLRDVASEESSLQQTMEDISRKLKTGFNWKNVVHAMGDEKLQRYLVFSLCGKVNQVNVHLTQTVLKIALEEREQELVRSKELEEKKSQKLKMKEEERKLNLKKLEHEARKNIEATFKLSETIEGTQNSTQKQESETEKEKSLYDSEEIKESKVIMYVSLLQNECKSPKFEKDWRERINLIQNVLRKIIKDKVVTINTSGKRFNELKLTSTLKLLLSLGFNWVNEEKSSISINLVGESEIDLINLALSLLETING